MSTVVPSQELMKKWPRLICATKRPVRTPRTERKASGTVETTRSFTTTLRPNVSQVSQANGSFEGFFINALVQASSCKRSRNKWPHKSRPIPATNRETWVQPVMSYNRLPLLVREEIDSIGVRLSKKRLIGLVDYYDYSYEIAQTIPTAGQPSVSDIEISASTMERDLETHQSRVNLLRSSDKDTLESLDRTGQIIDSTYKAIVKTKEVNTAQDVETQTTALFQVYYTLPPERFLLLHPSHREKLLDLALRVPKKSEAATFRFLKILNDMLQVNICIPNPIYNHAIHLVGRTLSRVSHEEVESALLQWTSMEANSAGDIETFNILFDVAVKGQQFALAEMILSEIEQRGLSKDRFTRVGLIYYYGIRGDGDAIRKTYRDLVEKDLVVDTTVLNCVIASLLRAGEEEAAHQVYQRMKDVSGEHSDNVAEPKPSPKTTARALRNLVRTMDTKDERVVRQLRQEQDIFPDADTFKVLVSHHVSTTGNFDKIHQYLEEMHHLGINLRGRIFMELFRGFWRHGGKRYTLWNATTLDKVYESFKKLANEEANRAVYWDKWTVLWLLRAYVRCYSRNTAMEKWELIKEGWNSAAQHEVLMLGVIDVADKRSQDPTKQKRIDMVT